jgi:hypothetical protein
VSETAATVACPDCGASSESSDPSGTQWQCESCGRGYYLRRCADCREVSYVAIPHGWHQPWFCTWCSVPNLGFTQNQDAAAATVADLAVSVARTELSFALAKDVLAKDVLARDALAEDAQPATGEPDPPARGEEASGSAAEPERVVPAVPVIPRRSPRPRTILTVVACVLAVVSITAVWAAMRLDLAAPASKASPASGPDRLVSVTAEHVSTVIFQGVPGKLSVVGASTTRVSLTGQLHWTTRAPVARVRYEYGGHVLLVSYRCAAASACTENFRLTVPYDEAVTLNQSSAQLTLTGLAGAVSVRASNVLVIATGLRTAALTASITSGTLAASFEVAPALVDVTLMSAQGTLRLPASVGYRVSQRVADGDVAIAVPQASTNADRVIAHITSGDLELLPA